MSKAMHFRKTVDLCRRVASIPTSGGHRADRALLVLAGKLDRDAATLDDQEPAEKPRGVRVARNQVGK